MKVLYPGSFNPWHNGHQYIFDEACEIFGKENVFIGIACNRSKFKTEEEFQAFAEFNKWVLRPITENVVLVNGLVAEYCKENDFQRVVRGIRQGYDLEQEEKLAYWNKELGGVKTVYIPSPVELNQISSSVIREFRKYGKPFEFLSKYAPEHSLGRWYFNETIPTVSIYFGKSSVGKTTTLSETKTIEVDKAVWQYLRGSSKEEISKRFQEVISNQDRKSYEKLITVLSCLVDWEGLFTSALSTNIDFPVLGNYFDHIPPCLRYRFKFIEFTNTQANREKFCVSRGWKVERLKEFDFFYKNPPFADETVILG